MSGNEEPKPSKIVTFTGEKSARMQSAETHREELEGEIGAVIETIAMESHKTTAELMVEIGEAISEARSRISGDTKSAVVDPTFIQLDRDAHAETSYPIIAGFLSDLGEKIGAQVHNIEAIQMAAGHVLTQWVQAFDPKVRIEFSSDKAETRKWHGRAVVRMLIQK